MMEAARTSEMLVNFYWTTRRYNPEDNHLHTHRHENLKSHKKWKFTASKVEYLGHVLSSDRVKLNP
jgi:hypothetical protein